MITAGEDWQLSLCLALNDTYVQHSHPWSTWRHIHIQMMTTKQRASLNKWYRPGLVVRLLPSLYYAMNVQSASLICDISMPDLFLNDDQLSNEELPTSFNARCMCSTDDMMKYNFFPLSLSPFCDENECRKKLIACNSWWVAKRAKRFSPCFTESEIQFEPISLVFRCVQCEENEGEFMRGQHNWFCCLFENEKTNGKVDSVMSFSP